MSVVVNSYESYTQAMNNLIARKTVMATAALQNARSSQLTVKPPTASAKRPSAASTPTISPTLGGLRKKLIRQTRVKNITVGATVAVTDKNTRKALYLGKVVSLPKSASAARTYTVMVLDGTNCNLQQVVKGNMLLLIAAGEQFIDQKQGAVLMDRADVEHDWLLRQAVSTLLLSQARNNLTTLLATKTKPTGTFDKKTTARASAVRRSLKRMSRCVEHSNSI